MRKPVIVIAERDHLLRADLKNLLCAQGYDVQDSASKEKLILLVSSCEPDLLIISTNIDMHGDGLEVAGAICLQHHNLPVIITTAESSEDFAISALRIGAKDYFKKPFSFDEFARSVNRNIKASDFKKSPCGNDMIVEEGVFEDVMVGTSRTMLDIKRKISRLAKSDCNVLITGETGTGKELVAELLHAQSSRRKDPLICVNCAALPEHLVESELFGSEKGSFTGAVGSHKGKFEQADGGTIFLDEIGDMSTYAQAKILRAIETKKICRVGGKKEFKVDIRGVAATNHDIDARVAESEFREDLYYRLNVGRVHIPPLRERKDDIPPLVNYYIRKINKGTNNKVEGFTPDSWSCLMQYAWPGNVRELKNVVEASFIDMAGREVEFIRIPDYLKRKIETPLRYVTSERDSLVSALRETNWNKSKAAERLCWSRMTLYRKMKRYKVAPG